LTVAGVVVAGLIGGVVWVATGAGTAPGTPAPTAVPTGHAPVVRVDVAQRRQFSGSLGHAGGYLVVAPAVGTLTGLPDLGRVVRQGHGLYEVDGQPVLLLYGRRPAWRPLRTGMTDGPDVQQLETALRALGYGSDLTVDRHFSGATYRAVRRWQAAARLPVTGTVPLGQVVFLPQAIRITGHSVELGATVQPGTPVETGTTDQRVVVVQLPTADLPTTRVGDPVLVLLPDGHTQRRGRIITIGPAAVTTGSSSSSGSGSGSGSGNAGDGSGGQPTAPVTIAVDGTIQGFIEQAQVPVFIIAELHKAVLAVPIVSLRTLPDGQDEVVVVDGGRTRPVPVSVGLFDDIAQLAEVSGPGLTEGRQVEVPSGTS
jgi:peptidoglycan hydrolase-like protein with peptidoglycan-binding domain